MSFNQDYRKKTIFPHRYSKMFYDFWISHEALWTALKKRLEIEKDAFILISGDTGCQPAGSKVLMANGEWKDIKDINIGEEILSPQKDGKDKISKVIDKYNFFSDDNYEIFDGENNLLYKCTSNHLVPLIDKRGNIIYLEARDIREGISIRKRNYITYINIISKRSREKYEVFGLEIDSPSKLYITDNYMITHNTGKSHFVGTFNFKFAEKEDNFILNDGSKMFEAKKHYIIDPEEFAYKMITNEGCSLWGDEFRRGANRRNWYSPINKAIVDRKNTNRKLFNMYWVCMPFEREFDPSLAGHLTLWIWIRRGVGEIYCKISGRKGGTGLDIQKILDREEKWLKENPKKTIVPPIIHPEYIGRIAFAKLPRKLKDRYDNLVVSKKATGDLTDEEKKKFGIIVELTPEDQIKEAVEKVKKGEISDKKTLWESLNSVKIKDADKLKTLNFYLKLEGFSTFSKLFNKKKDPSKEIEW